MVASDWTGGGLSSLGSALLCRAGLQEEICDLLHIDLQEGHSNSELGFIRVFSYVIENVAHASGNNAALIVQALPSLARIEMV